MHGDLPVTRLRVAVEAIGASSVRLSTRLFAMLSLNGARRMGKWLGKVSAALHTSWARVTEINIALAYPELDNARRRLLVRDSLQHTGMLLAELGALSHWSKARARDLVRAEHGVELLNPNSGRGVLVLAPHFGNWEYLAIVLGKFGAVAVYDRPRMRALEAPILKARQRFGLKMVAIGTGGLKTVYRTLESGGVVVLMPDQAPQRRAGLYAPFFGTPALTMTLAHRLIRRTRPHVLLTAVRRISDGFEASFQALDDATLASDEKACVTAINSEIERLVRSDPGQYAWEYRRFKRPPDGQPSPYPRHPRRFGRRGPS